MSRFLLSEKRAVGVVGYACGLGEVVPGCHQGPRVLRARDLLRRIEVLGHTVKDYGDSIAGDPAAGPLLPLSEEERLAHDAEEVLAACVVLGGKTSELLSEGCWPLIIGGDHSQSMGSIGAISRHYAERGERIGVIWVDTHPDVHTPSSSATKRLFGTSAGFVLGRFGGGGAFSQLTSRAPAVDASSMVYLGLRDVDPAEREFLRAPGAPECFTMKDIDLLGIAEVARRAHAIASKNTAGYVVSFDLDVCDPQLTPGTGTPVRGGLSFREAHLLMELFWDFGGMLGLEMTELNPELDENFITADLAIGLIETALGKSII